MCGVGGQDLNNEGAICILSAGGERDKHTYVHASVPVESPSLVTDRLSTPPTVEYPTTNRSPPPGSWSAALAALAVATAERHAHVIAPAAPSLTAYAEGTPASSHLPTHR